MRLGFVSRPGLLRSRPAQGGFTLVEMMVTLVITALIITFLVRSMLNVQQSWSRSEDRVDATQNTRAALDTMVRDLRMAGSGFGGRPVTTGGVPDNLVYPCRPAPGGADADTLYLTGSLAGVEAVSVGALGGPSDGLFVTDTDGFAAGDLVVVTNGVDANMFEVTGVVAATGSLEHSGISSFNDPLGHVRWPNGGYPAGSTVVQVQRVTYWVSDEDEGHRLMRRVGDETPLPVAFGVQDLRIRYGLADGTVTADPADPTLIRSVFLDYVPEARDGAGPAAPVSVQVQPRVLG